MSGSLLSAQQLDRQEEGLEPFPLSSVQEVIWLDHALHPDTPIYNIGLAWRIQGSIDADVLRRAINLVANGNDALRIVLCDGDGRARQRILPEATIQLPCLNLTARPDAEEAAMRHMQESFARPFDLRQGPLWTTELIRVSATCSYWLQRYHHLITDGFGVTLTVHAVARAYNRILTHSVAEEEGPSYGEFVREDREYLHSSRFQRDREFWFGRYPRIPESPFMRSADSLSGKVAPSGRVCWQLRRSLYEQLTRLATQHGFTIMHVMLAAVSAYCARVSAVEEIVIGVPVHNRPTARSKQTIGMFSSVIPLGIRVDRGASFSSLLSEVSTQLRRSYRHQRFPIAELNRNLKLSQSGRHQLFDIRLSFMGFSGDAFFGAAPTKVVRMHHGFERVPLSIEICDYHVGEPVLIDFTFSTAAFQRQDVERIQTGLELILESVVRDADQGLHRLPIMTEAQRRRALYEFNDTAVAYPQERLVHELFEDRVRERPRAVAMVCDGEELSYQELNRRANCLAHHLLAQGLKPDDRVGICLERGAGQAWGILGILKAGGAYMPLDPAYPEQRLAYMLSDSAPVALVTQRSLAGRFAHAGVPLVVLDAAEDAAGLAAGADSDPDGKSLGLSSQHAAYVIYTSGSTGAPKGVIVEHRNVVNLLCAMSRAPGMGPRDSLLAVTTLSFDIASVEMLLPLVSGARIILMSQASAADATQLRRVLESEAITVLQATPTTWRMLLDSGWQGAADLRALSGGEALATDLATRLNRCVGEVWNLYGPTETTIYSVGQRIEVREGDGAAAVPIGRPLENTRVYVLDERGEPVPIGVTGELYIGGAGVARGYLNRPELTRERFLADPFSTELGSRMYRTGDLVRYREDGTLEFLGRNDFQVKVRGFRIEPGEIEARLLECAGIREAVVLAREDRPGDKRLVAYVVVREGAEVSEEELRRRLSSRLAAYMVPSLFVRLAELPLTPNGKVDRKALPAPDWSAVSRREYEAPRDPVELTVAGICREVLGVERVGRHDDFFELGGHSLHAQQLLVQLRERLSIGLSLSVIFDSRTVMEIAQRIQSLTQLKSVVREEPSDIEPEKLEEGWV